MFGPWQGNTSTFGGSPRAMNRQNLGQYGGNPWGQDWQTNHPGFFGGEGGGPFGGNGFGGGSSQEMGGFGGQSASLGNYTDNENG